MDDGQDVVIAPISPLTAISEPIRRRRSSGSGDLAMSRRAPSGRLRQVAIGPQLARWDAMKTRLGVDSHAQLAEVLLDGMEAVVDGDVVWGTQCTNPNLKNKLSSFFKRRAIPALIIPRRSRAAAKTKPAIRRRSPVKLKIIIKKEAKSQKVQDENGHEEEEEGEPSSDEDMGEAQAEDSEEDGDYSPQEPSRHGLKKAWLGRHLKGKSKTHRHRKVAVPKACLEEDEDEDEEEVVTPRRKLRRTAARKKLVKQLKQLKAKQEKAKATTKTVEELFGADAVLVKIYCCRKCTSQLDSAEVMKAHWQTHAAEDDEGGTPALVAKKEDDTGKGRDGDFEEAGKGGTEAEDSGDGDQEAPADVQRMARVMTRCPLCQKLFSNILAHTACHSNYLCEECGMLFRQRRSLKLHHRAVHELGDTGQLPFICNRCGRAFRWEASLRKHRTLHSQHRQFICQTCGKSFKVQAHLKRHEIMHEEVKPFVCPHCGRRFTELSNMKVHTRVHTGEKPYVCDVCKKAYAHKVSLKTHKKKEHGIDMWQLGYITQPVIEFDDDGKETEYSIARRSRRPSFNTSSKARKRKLLPEKETLARPEALTKEDQMSQLVREKTLEKHPEMNEQAEKEDSEASQASQASQTSVTAHAPPQHFTESKMQSPLLHAQFQQQQQQHQQPPPPLQHQQHAQIQPPIQPPPEVHAPQHIQPQHLQMHSQSYAHSHPGESAQQHLEDEIESEPCSPEEEENPRLLQAELITNQLRHAQRLQIAENSSHPPQPLPLQLSHSQSLQPHHQPPPQQQQLPSHTQTQPLPHVQIPSMRQLPPQSHQASQRPPLPSFEAVTAPDRQGHPQYRQGMMNAMSGLDLNALVAGSMPYMYWGSQQYQGAPPYIQRNTEENSLESPKQ